MIRKIRIASQGIFLLIFLWLFLKTESRGADEIGYPVKIFLDADPLIFISTLLSSRSFDNIAYLAIFVMLATVFLGRVFCGWICPMGTLNNLSGLLKRGKADKKTKNWYWLKYCILLFLLSASFFSVQITGIVDPVSFLIRSLSLAVYPAINYSAESVFNVFYGINILTGAVDAIQGISKAVFLPFQQPLFFQSIFIGIIFLLVLGANLVERRLWCKYLCPLGAFLGLLSKYSILKRSVSEGCNACGLCAVKCQGGALLDEQNKLSQTDCLLCMNCDDACPQKAVRFGFPRQYSAGYADIGKRRIVASILAGVITAPLFKISPFARVSYIDPKLIRPPGSLNEKEFLKRCVKCGKCMKVCITNGLQPTLIEAGLEGIWSPTLVPRIGYCEYNCTLCGQVCPTGAIKRLTVEEKRAFKIGLAVINKGRCLPFANGISCIVCEEVCPTLKKAIWFEQVTVKDRDGRESVLKQPRVDPDQCIGCGICETFCPVMGQPAIYVIALPTQR